MSLSLLSTKLYIPPPRVNVVSRSHLIEKLLSGIDHPGCFTLVSGPAGFGKTTLLSEFTSQFKGSTAWVSLDEGDNDPILFWTYLITACQSVVKDAGESALELFKSPQAFSDDTVPTILINDLNARDRLIVLVLDDYQVIKNESIQASVLFLLDHLPYNLHMVLSTRMDPPWPLARFRARNQLIEVRINNLRFNDEEAAAFLNHSMGLNLSSQNVAALEERTEGWAAGLQLAAIALQSLMSTGESNDISAFVQAFSGSQRYVAEYLVEEVLQRLPAELRTFLLQTSILKRMNAGLCEAVTGCQDGQATLQFLRRANIFVVSLDQEDQWFRYHHLFADLLQARLQQEMALEAISGLQLRAALWYEQNGFMHEAVDHVLAAKDFKRAASLVDRAGLKMIFTEQHLLLRNWLEALPAESLQSFPRLEIYQFLLDLSLGKLDMSEQTLRDKERLIKTLPSSSENDRLRRQAMVYLSAFFAHQNTAQATHSAKEILAEIPVTDLTLRSSLFSTLYRAYGMEGDVEKSAPAYLECLRLAREAGGYAILADTTMVRAFDLCQYGRLDEAAEYCHAIIDAGARSTKVFYPAGPCFIGLAGIYLERNDLQMAEDYLIRGMALCRQGAINGLYTGTIQWARLLRAKGDLEGANEKIRFLEQNFRRRDFTLTAQQVSICLARGDIASASCFVPPILEILSDSPYAHQLPLIAAEAYKLSLTRIRVAQGVIEQAMQVLDSIQATAESGKRLGRLMEVHLLRALALHKQAGGMMPDEAIASLKRALAIAEPAGYVLLFLEEGTALIPLLHAVAERQSASDPVKKQARKLLDAFDGSSKPAVPHPKIVTAGLVEHLTSREMEVLALLAAGCSNQVIAEKLFITVRTVKKHTGNIYCKLNATSRIHAVTRARELGLLSKD